MTDVHSPSIRSKNMRAIRSKDTEPEIRLRKALYAAGMRYRIHTKIFDVRPDIVFRKHRVAVFMHGCFWHGHHCPRFVVPKTRTEFWLEKIQKNKNRDLVVRERLLYNKWRVAVVWECALVGRGKRPIGSVVGELTEWLINSELCTLEIAGVWP